jgi:DNA gyrase subunit A
MRGKTTTEETKGRTNIIVSEIPYMVNKADLVTSIARLATEKKLPDVSDIKDESAKGKVRIVIELKKGADSKFTLNRLFKDTRLQDSFDANIIGLVDGKPMALNLKKIIEVYVKHRESVIEKRTKYDLKKAKEREEIVKGLLIALKDIDSVVKLIKSSKNTTEAHADLMKKFELSTRQAQAILEMKLSTLTGLEQDKLKKEEKELIDAIKEFEKILSSNKEILSLIKKDVSEIKRKYGDNRRTYVLQRVKEIQEHDLVEKKEVVVMVTDKGYIKRMDTKTYKEQKRGGRGVIGSDLATGDFVKQLIICSTHDYLMLFTSKGKVYWVKAHQIPAAERYSKGKALINVVSLGENETIQSIISLKNFENFLFMATKKGQVKKIALNLLSKPRASGVRIMNLPPDNSDSIVDVKPIKEKQEVLLVTKDGQAIRFNSDEVRPMGRASYGVTGIKMDKEDYVVSVEVLDAAESILTITEKGYGKRSLMEDYRLTGRAGKGVINLKVSDKTGGVVTTVSVKESDTFIVTTAKGIVIKTQVKEVRVMGRATQGVRIIKLQQGDKVSDLVNVALLEEVEGKIEEEKK